MFNPVDNSFSRDVRLTRPTQFQTVFRQGRRLGNPLFSLVVADNKTAGASTARLGLAISRKVAARAVARNRIKRLARETFRARRDTLPAVDIVLMARRGAAAGTRQELRQALMTLFKHLQV